MRFRFWLLGTLFALFVAYFPVLTAQKTVDPDANIILTNLSSVTGPQSYVDILITLNTIDLQPVRDLTLFLDLWIFHSTGINIFIWQNLFWWILTLIMTRSLLRLVSQNPLTDFYLIAFAVYPLFSGVLSWGMNRKHLLAFFFILAATRFLFSRLKTLTITDLFVVSALFLFSVFSQPIFLLWPIWVCVVFFQEKWPSKSRFLVISLFSIMLLAIILNFLYYNNSPSYLFFYPAKTSDLLNIPDKILALGHYAFQIFFPYLLSFKYHLGHWSVFVGLIALIIFSYIMFKFTDRTNLLRWGFFGILPVLTVLNDPHVMADSYLLMPVLAVWILLMLYKNSQGVKIRTLLLTLILFFTARTHLESSNWTDRVKLADVSFERRPSCLSAFNDAKVGFDLYVKKTDALSYIFANDCLSAIQVNPFFYRSMVIMFSHYYFHSDEISFTQRLERLEKLSENNILAHLTLVGFFIKNDKVNEARSEIDRLLLRWEKTEIPSDYHEITARFVKPFCEREMLERCLAVTKSLVSVPNRPNL